MTETGVRPPRSRLTLHCSTPSTRAGLVDNANTRITNDCYDDAGDLRSVTGPKGAAELHELPESGSESVRLHRGDAHDEVRVRRGPPPDEGCGRTRADHGQSAYDENGQVTSEGDRRGVEGQDDVDL